MSSTEQPKPPRRSNPVPAIIAVVALCFLAFVGGAVVTDFRLPPYKQVFQDAFDYLHARNEQKREVVLGRAEGKNVPPLGRLSIPAGAESFRGYTFATYDAVRPSTARLFDMDGRVVHQWHKDFSQIFPHYPGRKPPGDIAFSWRYGWLFPNGDVIVTVKGYGVTPYGYGLAKLDKDSNVIWAIPDHFHHHFSVASNGHIFALVQEWRNTEEHPIPGLADAPKLVLETFVVEVSADGKVLNRHNLVDAMAAPGTRPLLASSIAEKYDAKAWDLLHPNDAEYVEAEFAAKHPSFAAGDVLLSFRDLDALVLFDMKTGQVKRVFRGPWVRQHDPDLLPNGDILVFDNRGDNVPNAAGGNNGSRVLEFNPDTELVTWAYEGTKEHPLRTDVCGGNDRLPNGNTLITEDEGGRVFETTPEGKIVWEYRDVRIHHAIRVATDWLKFTPAPPNLGGGGAVAAADAGR